MTLLALVSTLLVAEPAPPPGAEAEIERGRLLIRDLYEEKALETLAPFLDDVTLPPGLRARALVYAGIAQMNLGNDNLARATFGRALQIDEGAVLPEWVSRKVRLAFTAEAERLVEARNASARAIVYSTRAGRHPWVGPALLGATAVGSALAVLGFVRWSQFQRQSEVELVAVDSARAAQLGRPFFFTGEAAAAIGGALLLAALWWWLWPG